MPKKERYYVVRWVKSTPHFWTGVEWSRHKKDGALRSREMAFEVVLALRACKIGGAVALTESETGTMQERLKEDAN